MEQKPSKIIQDEDLIFLSKWTKETNFEALREHVFSIFEIFKSQKIHVYVCLEKLMFLKPRLPMHFAYKCFIDYLKSNENHTVADLGCCFGQEVRNWILEGINPKNIFALDINDNYWNAGREIYMDTLRYSSQRLNNITTVFADFAQNFPLPEDTTNRIPDCFKGHFNGILCQMIFHVLTQEEIENLVKRMHYMLKIEGILIGSCIGNRNKPSLWTVTPKGVGYRYLHSLESLKELFTKNSFGDIEIIESELNDEEANQKVKVNRENSEGNTKVEKVRLKFIARKK